MISGEKAYNQQEAAKLLGLHPITLRRAIQSGELRVTRGIDRRGYRITQSELDRFVNERTGEAKTNENGAVTADAKRT
jgi:excisionase family DNA binding protein